MINIKIKRHSKIIEIINSNPIETQEELALFLKHSGFNVTQATVSRDIRELKLTKVSSDNGKLVYVPFVHNDNHFNQKLVSIFKDYVLNIDYSYNTIVIKTTSGMAMAVACSIDSMNDPNLLGSIAGDDTVFCITKSENISISIVQKFKHIINSF